MSDKPPGLKSVRELVPLCQEYHKRAGNEAWGTLHIMFEDNNLSDDNVVFCICEAVKNKDTEAWLIASHMLEYTQTQRRKLVALANERTK